MKKYWKFIINYLTNGGGITGNYFETLDERVLVDYDDELYDKYLNILMSDLSILKIWISLLGENTIIKTRSNNTFYSDCFMHRASDIPVCIKEQEKSFFCYGCGWGGTIVTLVSKYFNIEIENTVNILYSYINNDLDSLDKEQLEIVKTIFKNYDSPFADKYFNYSKKKSIILNSRIDNYIENYGYSADIVKKMTKRLCCSRKYIENRISELSKKGWYNVMVQCIISYTIKIIILWLYYKNSKGKFHEYSRWK